VFVQLSIVLVTPNVFDVVEEFLLRLRCSPLYINRHQSIGRIGVLKIGVLMSLNFIVSSRNLACR